MGSGLGTGLGLGQGLASGFEAGGLHISFWFSFCLVTASRLANLCSFSVAMKLVTCLGLGLGLG